MTTIKHKIENLRKKESEFMKAGDLRRATHCKIIAGFLEDALKDRVAVAV